MNHVVRDIPAIQQRLVEELIERNVTLHHRSMDEIWHRFRNTVIVWALHETNGNMCAAARLLQVHRNTFWRWMREANLVDGKRAGLEGACIGTRSTNQVSDSTIEGVDINGEAEGVPVAGSRSDQADLRRPADD